MRSMFNKRSYTFKLVTHNAKEVNWIYLPYNRDLQKHLKEFVKATWIVTHKCWYCTDNVYYRQNPSGKSTCLPALQSRFWIYIINCE